MMNMQTPALPIQVTSTAPAPQRANPAPQGDGAQFSQALSREMEQRHSAPPPSAAPVKPAGAPPQQGAKALAKSGADEEKDDATDAADAADAASAAAAGPVADMLALVASLNPPAAAAPAIDPATAAAQAAAATALKGGRQDGSVAVALKAGAETAPLAGAAIVPPKTALPAADGAGRFALKGADSAPKDADLALPRVKPQAASVAAQPGEGQDTDVRKAAAGTDLPPAALKTAVSAEAAPPRLREAVADLAVAREPAVSAPVMAPVQQASLAMTQAVGAPTDRIAARVGTPGWDNQVGQKIVWMVAGKEQSATLTLNPPDMGPMQVVLSVTNDQATVTFSAAQPEVRQALENAMPKLREMMGENGIALGNASVNAGSPEQRQAQSGEQSRGQGGGNRLGGGGADKGGTIELPRVSRLDTGTGLVDTFA